MGDSILIDIQAAKLQPYKTSIFKLQSNVLFKDFTKVALTHYVKSVRIRSYSGPNAGKYGLE